MLHRFKSHTVGYLVYQLFDLIITDMNISVQIFVLPPTLHYYIPCAKLTCCCMLLYYWSNAILQISESWKWFKLKSDLIYEFFWIYEYWISCDFGRAARCRIGQRAIWNSDWELSKTPLNNDWELSKHCLLILWMKDLYKPFHLLLRIVNIAMQNYPWGDLSVCYNLHLLMGLVKISASWSLVSIGKMFTSLFSTYSLKCQYLIFMCLVLGRNFCTLANSSAPLFLQKLGNAQQVCTGPCLCHEFGIPSTGAWEVLPSACLRLRLWIPLQSCSMLLWFANVMSRL